MARSKYDRPHTRSEQAAIADEPATRQSGKKSGKQASYRIQVYTQKFIPVGTVTVHGAKEMRAEKRSLVAGEKRGTYKIEITNEKTGKMVH